MRANYVIPSMEEISKIKGTNSYNVVSTFSGCGGSCLGFEMAGYKVLWANEFIEEAATTYALNHRNVILDRRDIRQITGAEIKKAINNLEIDVLEGSPPCSSFSTAGALNRNWGKSKIYSDTVQRSDDLFFEFIRLLKELQPRVFVAENVTGLVKGKSIGYFKIILEQLKESGYKVEAKIIDASYLGVPQARQRIILIGVRNDLAEKYDQKPRFPVPRAEQIPIRDILERNRRRITHDEETKQDITLERYALGKEYDKVKIGGSSSKYFQLYRPSLDKPIGTITATGGGVGVAGVTHPTEKRKFTLKELRLLASFPHDFILTGTYAQRWERIGRSVPPLMMKEIARTIQIEILDKCDGKQKVTSV